MNTIEIQTELKSIKDNIFKEISRIEALESNINVETEPDAKYRVEINGKVSYLNIASNVLIKLMEEIGLKKVFASKYSYRNSKINDVMVACPALIDKNSTNFSLFIKENSGMLYKKVNKRFFICNNMSANRTLSIARELALAFDTSFEYSVNK